MRNSRRLHVVEGDDYTVLAPSATPLGDRILLLNTSSNSSLISSSPSNSGNGSTTPDNSHIYRTHFSTSVGILIVALLGVVFFTGVFSFYIRRFTVEEETARRRAAENGRMTSRASQGLDKTSIETLPLFKYSLVKGLKQGKQALECAVCLSEFEDGETLRLLPECSHTFHLDCIDIWLYSHATCPLCRTSLIPEEPMNLVPQRVSIELEGQPHQNGSSDDNGIGGTRGRNEMIAR